jgi:hypothetical protein
VKNLQRSMTMHG